MEVIADYWPGVLLANSTLFSLAFIVLGLASFSVLIQDKKIK